VEVATIIGIIQETEREMWRPCPKRPSSVERLK
jgi:hypothetical protein